MSGLRTFAFLFLCAIPTAAPALDLVRAFANCTGRYSATMEHQWLMDTASADRSQARRNMFADLLDAARAPDQGRQVLAWRIEAKVAQAALLTTATFGTHPDQKRAAAERAKAQIDMCDRLLLGV